MCNICKKQQKNQRNAILAYITDYYRLLQKKIIKNAKKLPN